MSEIFCTISEKVILPSEAESHSIFGAAQEGQGAVLWFYGNVRNKNDGQAVRAVTYEGAAALGEKVLRDICQECQSQWGSDLTLYVAHRLGCLVVGETSVAIGVTSPHRKAAYEASRYIIEQIKVRLPIWKQEHYINGDEAWLRGVPLNGPAGVS